MKPTTIIGDGVPNSPVLWPIALQAFVGAFIVGAHVFDLWGSWDFRGRLMAVLLLFGLLFTPVIEIWRQRMGKPVRFNILTGNGYALVWIATIVFTHGSWFRR